MQPPLIRTARLTLRSFTAEDAAEVQRLAGDRAVAENLSDVPHPYPDGAAEQWIATHAAGWRNVSLCCFAIVYQGRLVGAISLMDIKARQAELGYWIGQPYWNLGICSEAAKEVVAFATNALELERLYAHHLTSNPRSGRVLIKSGFVHLKRGFVQWPKRRAPVEVDLYEYTQARQRRRTHD